MVDEQASLAYLLKERHAEWPLFLVAMDNTDLFAGFGDEAGKELFRQHLLYWWKLEDAGKLFAAGPVEFGRPEQSGLAVLMGVTREEAVALAEAEPFHVAGWRRNTVRSWQLNEGLVVAAAAHLMHPPQ